jgi:hypothetical protein
MNRLSAGSAFFAELPGQGLHHSECTSNRFCSPNFDQSKSKPLLQYLLVKVAFEDSKVLEDSDDNTSINAAAADQDRLVELDDDLEEEFDDFESDLQRAVEIFREQRAKGNKKFLKNFIETPGGSTQKLVREVRTLENQQTMPQTWGSWKYQATMYYQ